MVMYTVLSGVNGAVGVCHATNFVYCFALGVVAILLEYVFSPPKSTPSFAQVHPDSCGGSTSTFFFSFS